MSPAGPCRGAGPEDQARAALLKAAAFYRDEVAAHGGYVYRYSADLEKREGEGKVDLDRVWVQPSGTPLGRGWPTWTPTS
jgi:hypothetical protein